MTDHTMHDAISAAMRATDELTRYAGCPETDPSGLLGPTERCLEAVGVMLHQVADLQERQHPSTSIMRSRACQAVWELHRAGVMAHQIAGGVGRAHNLLSAEANPDLVAVPLSGEAS